MTSKQTLAAGASAAFLTAGVKLLAETPQVHYRFEQVGDVNMFYREAGKASDPAVLLIHGYAASSYMWRDVIAGLPTVTMWSPSTCQLLDLRNHLVKVHISTLLLTWQKRLSNLRGN